MNISKTHACLLVLMSLAVATPQVKACTFHMASFSSIFDETYPGSLSVAAAVARARSDNRLTQESLESGEMGLIKASYKLNKLGRHLNSSASLPKVDFFLMFAGQQLWTYYRVKQFSDQPVYAVHVHSAAPVHDVPVVVTSYYVVAALQEGVMSFDEAVATGLIQIRNDPAGRVSTMFRETFRGAENLS